MVTIGLGRRVIGLTPTLSSAHPKQVSVALLELKSHKQDVADGKEIGRVNVAFGKIATFRPAEKIKFTARPSFDESLLPKQLLKQLVLPKPGGGQCCVNINPGGQYQLLYWFHLLPSDGPLGLFAVISRRRTWDAEEWSSLPGPRGKFRRQGPMFSSALRSPWISHRR